MGSGQHPSVEKYEGFGFMYKTSIEGKQLHFVGYSFDDDTDIIQSGQPGVLIPQVRPAHKYPNSPWEMIHPPGGDNAVCM
jgi:hypothetical protein